MSAWDIRGKTALITGGNTGIGLATARALAQRGASVTITSRDERRGHQALEILKSEGLQVSLGILDLASFASIRSFAERFLAEQPRLSVLINNAGLVLSDRRVTEDGFEMTFGVNHLGHFLLTSLLLARLVDSAPARIINLSSSAHRGARTGLDFDDLQSERGYRGFPVYCRSKLANIYFTRALAKRLANTSVTVNAVHPGVVASGFAADGDTQGWTRRLIGLVRPFMIGPDRGARCTVHVATSAALSDVTGRYFERSKITQESRAARDDEAAERLWTISENLIAQASDRPAQQSG